MRDYEAMARNVASRIAAPARPIDIARVYYHGTPKKERADRIMAEGLLPDMRAAKGQMAPVHGRVYLTPDIGYAAIYAIGGNMLGSVLRPDWIEREGQYGYMLVIPGSELRDIQPDEDSVGEMIEKVPWLRSVAERRLTSNQLAKVLDGDASWQAAAGKKLMPFLSDGQKQDLIDRGAHVANEGRVQPSQCWQIDRGLCQDLKKDGSNFFQVAERYR